MWKIVDLFNIKSSSLIEFTIKINIHKGHVIDLTLSWRRPLSYRNQSIDNDPRHESVKR